MLKKGGIQLETKNEWVMIDDTNIVAYLHYRGFKFSPIRKSGERHIGFKVYGDIDGALSDFYNNEPVAIQDYVGCLKKVRGSMFLLKGIDEQDKTTLKEE
jgi:hypothetical protein